MNLAEEGSKVVDLAEEGSKILHPTGAGSKKRNLAEGCEEKGSASCDI